MNLDDQTACLRLDPSGMLDRIRSIPLDLSSAYQNGLDEGAPGLNFGVVHCILAVGVGDAILGADLLAAYSADRLPVPMIIQRDDQLPAWASGHHSLVIVHDQSSQGWDAKGILAEAQSRGCQAVWIGSPREKRTSARGSLPVWQPPAQATQAWYFGRLYAALERAGYLPPLGDELKDASETLRKTLAALLPEVSVSRNPAKRLAGQFYERRVMLFGAGFLAPVARLWKMRLNNMAKAGCDFEIIPEADYNSIAGLERPAQGVKDLMAVFLQASCLTSRNLRRLDLTREFCLQLGLNTDFIEARGATPFVQMWNSVLFAEMTAYYLAMAYGVDPGDRPLIDAFQAELTSLMDLGGM